MRKTHVWLGLFLGLLAFPLHASAPAPLVVLDAGHGGSADGAKVFPVKEKRIALFTALRAKKALEGMGYRVLLTRTQDRFVDLQQRVTIANRAKAALFVSIHFNSSPNPSAHGIEIYYYNAKQSPRTKASQRLAHHILKAATHRTAASSRGTRQGNFHVIRETKMPAVLFEGGFLTNEHERLKLRNKEYLTALAEGIAAGIDGYFASKERPRRDSNARPAA